MAELNVITSMLDDLFKEQPIHTALCIGQNLQQYNNSHSIQWQYFSVSELLSLPFTQRYDLAFVCFDVLEVKICSLADKTQILVKLRDLFAKRIVVIAQRQDEKLLRSLGFTQFIDQTLHADDFALWQFNILTYKNVPDWLNAKFWANPENWNKFRW